ncbi:hypothetical protein [uncultured Maribacter sp.]|uniref:hypothetical protein n=1 Tax=uncultured Maribacter sp. TaxID=431308 RepID=UPI0030EF1C62|tara:strand:- start:54171 stop:55160 length:990 start_codon:yes stop_codon:yes gene_type:complete
MIYLGDQISALSIYSEATVCWLGVKLMGRKTNARPKGFHCGKQHCNTCDSLMKIRSGVNQDFRNLFSPVLVNEIISSKPHKLYQINQQLKNQYLALHYSEDDFKTEAYKVFVDSGYTSQWFLPKKWNYKLAELLDKHTCTYCNREYIFVHKKKKGKGMVPQMDHWFAKSYYPLLALSFYNLIPSCGTCNGIKSSVEMDLGRHLHPYVDKNVTDSYKFSYLFKSTNDFKIIFKNNLTASFKPQYTFEALNLEMIYQGHSNKELRDLLDLRYKYSENYLQILLEKTFGNLAMSDQEKYRLIFGIEIDKENYHKRIMSKFKKDIIEELLSSK